MDIHDFLAHLNQGKAVEGGSEMHQMMHKVSQEALKLTAELNGLYHTPRFQDQGHTKSCTNCN